MNLQSPATHLLAAAAAFSLHACASVVSKVPVGAAPEVLNAAEWDGTWAFPDGTMQIEAIEPDDGVLRVSWIEEEDEKPTLKTMPIYIRGGSDWTYGNYRDPDAEDEDVDAPFYWGRIQNKEGRIIAWAPDASKFADLVLENKLPGTVDKKENSSNTILKKLKTEHYDLIEKETEGVLFEWDDPFILHRVSQ